VYGCRGHRAIACIGLALAGLGVLATLIVQNHALTLLKLSLILASLSTLTLLLDSLALLVAYTTLLLLSLASVKLLGAPVLVAVLAPLTPIVPRALTKPEVALSGLGTTLASLLLVEGALTLAPYIVVQAILAVLTSRRLHSIVLLVALATIPFGVTPAITASLLSTVLVVSAGGLIQKSGCPFRVDSNVVFSGSLLASIGVVALALWGWSSLAAGLWILGFLLATSGVLVPTRAPS
jgi:hypothetical protein